MAEQQNDQAIQAKKRADLARYLVAKDGIVNPTDQDKEIEKMAKQCPEATAKEKGLVTVVDKAFETMNILNGTQEPMNKPNPTEVTNPVATQPAATVSSAEELNIAKTLAAQNQQRSSVSTSTTIEQLVLDRPAPKDIIPAGTQGLMVEKSWNNILNKIKEGKYTVKADDGEEIDSDKRIPSTTNFNLLKEAFEAKKPVDIMVGDLNTKPIGYIVKKGSVSGSSQQPVQMTREDLERFVVLETAGYVLASDTKPGAKLRYVKAKQNPNNPGVITSGKTILADANKKAAIENGSYVISREKTKTVESTNCKSALAFRVIVNGETLADGTTPKTRTIRATLKADLPTLVRKQDFVDCFGTGERDTNAHLLVPPTDKQAQDISIAQRKAIETLRRKAKDPDQAGSVVMLADQLAAFDMATPQAPAGTVI